MPIEAPPARSAASGGWVSRLEERSGALAEAIEARAGMVLIAFSALFVFRFVAFDLRAFWYDEYFTLAVARLGSFGAMWGALKNGLDLNPPLGDWITHVSLTIFGQNELAARMPSALAFLGFSLLGYAFVARRLGKLAGLNTALLLALTGPVTLIGQERPYGMLLAFAGLAFVSWQRACEGIRRRLYLPMTTLALGAALLCHCYAILLFVPLAGAELARWLTKKNADWPVLLSIFAAAPAMAAYLPVMAAAKRFVPGSVFETGWDFIPRTYALTLHDGWGFIAILALVPLFSHWLGTDRPDMPGFRPHEAVMLGLVSLLPVFGVVLTHFTHSPWSERYALAALFGLCALLAWGVRSRLGQMVVLATLLSGCFIQNHQPRYQIQAERAARSMTRLPDEAFDGSRLLVISNGILMKHADNYETAERLRSVYYLLDPAASQRYSGALIFDQHFRLFQQYGALRSHLADYGEFTSAHKSFYLYGPLDYMDDWLVPKLREDGASIRVLRRAYFPLNPETETLIHDAFLCEVTMP